jgi:hypothetical protein
LAQFTNNANDGDVCHKRSFNAPHQHLPSAFPFFGRALSTWFDANSQWRPEENLSTVTKSRVFLSPPLGNETILWKLFSLCTLPFQKTFGKKVFEDNAHLVLIVCWVCCRVIHVLLLIQHFMSLYLCFPLILLPVFGKNEFRGKCILFPLENAVSGMCCALMDGSEGGFPWVLH